MNRDFGIPYIKNLPMMQDVWPMKELDLNTISSFGRIASAYDSPSQTGIFQRVFLFGLVLALRPKHALEIGFKYGGTSLVIACALKDIDNKGKLVAIDSYPEPAIDFASFGDMFHLYKGFSPEAVEPCVQILGGKIDFCHIDGDHSYEGVLTDLNAVKKHMSKNSYILCHDACWPEVRRGIEDFISKFPQEFVDCGLIDPFPNEEGWGGMHLLRVL